MANRRKGRELALQALYQFDITRSYDEASLKKFYECFFSKEGKNEFSEDFIRGVMSHLKELDELIEKYSENWKLPRMPVVDRNLLRMAIFELLHKDDIPVKVTLNEAIEIGKRFGSENTGSFVNGILDKIAKTLKKD